MTSALDAIDLTPAERRSIQFWKRPWAGYLTYAGIVLGAGLYLLCIFEERISKTGIRDFLWLGALALFFLSLENKRQGDCIRTLTSLFDDASVDSTSDSKYFLGRELRRAYGRRLTPVSPRKRLWARVATLLSLLIPIVLQLRLSVVALTKLMEWPEDVALALLELTQFCSVVLPVGCLVFWLRQRRLPLIRKLAIAASASYPKVSEALDGEVML